MKVAVALAALGVMLIGVSQGAASGTRLSPVSANLSVSVQGKQFMPVGVPTTYRVLVANKGAATARGIQLYINLPEDITLVRASPHCHGKTLVSCTVKPLGLAKFVYVRLVLLTKAAGVGVLQANVSANQWERDYENNFDSLPVAYQPGPAKADVSVTVAPIVGPPVDWSMTPTPPNLHGFTVSITNAGPGDSVRVLVRYGLPMLTLRFWQFGTIFKDSSGRLAPSTTCGWAPLGQDRDAALDAALGKPGYCILSVPAGMTQNYQLWVSGPREVTWWARVSPLTPDPDDTNNFVSPVFEPDS